MVKFHQKYDISESLSIISCYYYSNNNYIPIVGIIDTQYLGYIRQFENLHI